MYELLFVDYQLMDLLFIRLKGPHNQILWKIQDHNFFFSGS